MIIYTVQHPDVLEVLQKDGVVYPTPVLDDDMFTIPYKWMYHQMKKRGIPLNKNDGGIFWGGVDQRETQYISGILMILDVPDKELLMSDFMGWHFVLNDYPFILDDDLDVSLISKEDKEKSWEAIFKISYSNSIFTYSQNLLELNNIETPIIQVCFTKIKKEWLKEYMPVKRIESVI